MFDVSLSEIPVYRDGATTDLTYTILACKRAGVYNAVVYGRGTLKFYPNAQFWGITDSILSDLGAECLYTRGSGGYQGVHNCGKASVARVLERVRTQRGTTVVPEKVFADFNHGSYGGEERMKSRSLHPATHGVPPLSDLPVTMIKKANDEVKADLLKLKLKEKEAFAKAKQKEKEAADKAKSKV